MCAHCVRNRGTRRRPKCPPTDGGKGATRPAHARDATQPEEGPSGTAARDGVNMLGAISQTWKDKNCVLPPIGGPPRSQRHRNRN